MANVDHIIVYVTVPNDETARSMSQEILKQKLAACINAIPQMTSSYWWEGRIEESQEIVLLIKTRLDCFDNLCSYILQVHPYEIPCILKLPIIGGNPTYLNWIDEGVLGRTTCPSG